MKRGTPDGKADYEDGDLPRARPERATQKHIAQEIDPPRQKTRSGRQHADPRAPNSPKEPPGTLGTMANPRNERAWMILLPTASSELGQATEFRLSATQYPSNWSHPHSSSQGILGACLSLPWQTLVMPQGEGFVLFAWFALFVF